MNVSSYDGPIRDGQRHPLCGGEYLDACELGPYSAIDVGDGSCQQHLNTDGCHYDGGTWRLVSKVVFQDTFLGIGLQVGLDSKNDISFYFSLQSTVLTASYSYYFAFYKKRRSCTYHTCNH